MVQVPPPRLDFIDSSPLRWTTKNDTSKVYGSRVPTTPTSEIVTSRIFSPSVSNIMTSVGNSTTVAPISNTVMLVIGSTPSMSVAMSFLSTMNNFYFGMPSIAMLNALTTSQSTTQVSNIGAGRS
jgi:hypothetical protein